MSGDELADAWGDLGARLRRPTGRTADFNGWCCMCDRRIRAGVDLIVPRKGGYVHAACQSGDRE